MFILRHISTGKIIESDSVLEVASIMEVPLMAIVAGKGLEHNGWKVTNIKQVHLPKEVKNV